MVAALWEGSIGDVVVEEGLVQRVNLSRAQIRFDNSGEDRQESKKIVLA